MKRRVFLKGAAVAAAAGGVASPAIAQSMPEVKWRLTSSFPKSLDTIFGTAETFARYLSEATDGKFQVQTFAAGELVPGLQALDAASNGTVECAHTPTYFYVGKEAALALGTGIPWGLNARSQHSWWHFAGGEAIVNEALAKFNTVGVVCGNSGTQMGGWFRNEIRTLDDIKGLKFRIGGIGGQVLAKMGAVPQQIAPGDIYPALERGTLDAVEFVGPHDDEKLGFNRVAKYYYYPGFWEGGAMLHLVINKGAWDRLPKQYQNILKMCAEAANNWMLAKYDAVNPPALRRLVGAGTELRAFPLPVLEASWNAANELYAELSARSPLFKRGYESMVAFRGEQYTWTQVAEYAFDSFQVRQLRR
jgi:TRAP-type mannitol/chloroaromatic compound transport system substrate-binding protein